MREPSPQTLRNLLERPLQPMPGEGELSRGSSTRYTSFANSAQYFDVLARPQHNPSSSWAICWSDLMMTMFIMFAALYAFQLPKNLPLQVLPVAAPPVVEDNPILERLYAQSQSLIHRHGLEQLVRVSMIEGRFVRILVEDSPLFEPGSATVKKGARAILKALDPVLHQSPYALTVVSRVSGQEKPQAKFSSTWELASARATAVTRFFLGQGHAQGNFLVAGHVQHTEKNGVLELVLSPDTPIESPAGPDASSPAANNMRQWMRSAATEVHP